MTREARWRSEWEALRAEREAARRRWRAAADGLAARARDPLGLRTLVEGHPLAAAGIGAAVGALLVRSLPWRSVLRDAAVNVAVPWLAGVLKEPATASDRRAAPPAS